MSLLRKSITLPTPSGYMVWEEFVASTGIDPDRLRELLALGWLESGRWDSGVDPALRQEARVWLTTRDAGGFADLVCLSGHEHEDRSLWLRLQRRFWQPFLDGMDGAPAAAAPSDLPDDFPAAVKASETARSLLPALREAEHFLAALPDQCRLAAAGHPRMGQLLLRACDHIQRLLENRDELASLSYFWHEARQARGDELDALAGLARSFSQHLAGLNALLSS